MLRDIRERNRCHTLFWAIIKPRANPRVRVSAALREICTVCITTDNGSNILRAIRTILNWTHLPCFGHNLHLTIGNALKDDGRVDRPVAVYKKLINTFSYSYKKRNVKDAQKELNLSEHSLVTDIQMRWGSTQKMIGRVLEQEKAIRKVLRGDRKCSHFVPTWQDLDVLEALNAAGP